MTRKAILIESSNVKGQTDLPGARIDVENWKNFLKSDLGGAWHDSEVITLNKPWTSDVEKELKVSSDCYCFVAFSGHGSNGSVVLNDYNQEFPISSLKAKTDRTVLIVDACRGVHEAFSYSKRLKVAMANEAIVKGVAMEAMEGRATQFLSATDQWRISNRAQRSATHRSRWDTALGASLRGTVEMLACAKGQTSGENPLAGGYYSSLLLQSAERWNQRTTQVSAHTTKDAHDYAVMMLPPQQTPEYSPSWLEFPFAVKI